MKIKMKKVLALLLALSLVLVSFGDLTKVKAETGNQEITLTSLHGEAKITDTAIELWINFTGGTWSDWADWQMTWEPFDYEFNGVQKKVSIVQSAGANLLYVTIPISDIPATAGTRITIKAGDYAAQSGTSTGMCVTNDFEVVLTGDEPVLASQYDVVEVGNATVIHGTADQIQFSLNEKSGKAVTFGYHTAEAWNKCFLTPVNKDGNRAERAEWVTLKSGVFQNGSTIDYWPIGGFNFQEINTGLFYIGGLNATEGTVVTVKGAFALSDGQSWNKLGDKYFIFEEFSFTFTNGTWVFSRPYQDVTLTGLHGNTDSDDNQVTLWLTFSGGTWTDWNDWEDYWYPFVYEIDGVKKQVSTVQSAGANLLYVTIPTSDVPTTAGTKISIKAGDYAAKSGISTGLSVSSDFEIVMTGDKPVVASQYDVIEAGSATVIHGTADQIQFSLYDKFGKAITFGYHTAEAWNKCFLTPVNKDGNRAERAEWATLKSGVFQNGSTIDYWPIGGFNFQEINTGLFYIGGLNATEGTVVTVKGAFALSDGQSWNKLGDKYFIFEEFSFTYTNNSWVSSLAPSEPSYTEYTGTPIEDSVEWDGNNGFYFETEEKDFPYDANGGVVVTPETDEDKIYVAGEPTDIKMKKVGENRWYVCIKDAGITLEDTNEVSIWGTFVYDTHRITFEDELLCEYTAPEVVTYEGTPVLFEEGNYGSSVGFYFTSEDGAPCATDWSLTYHAQAGEENGVFVQTTSGTTKYDAIYLSKVNENLWYVTLNAVSNLSFSYGDVVTIKGNFASSDGTVVTFNEASFQFNGKDFSQGTFTATEFTITELYYNDSVFDENNQVWNLYFNPSVELPGDPDQTYYPYMTCEIDGTEYESYWYKSSSMHNGFYNLLIQIPAAKLHQNLEETHVITLKESAAQGRTSGTNTPHTTGIRLTQEFTFVVGDRHEASAPAIDYGNTNQTGGSSSALWVTTSDDFPITSWTYSLKKADENSGIFIYDSETKTYTSTDGTMKRHMDGGYYIEGFETVETGDIILLKGTFSMSNLSFITFGTAKYEWNGSKWIVCSDIDELESTGEDGDANSDYNLNSADLVRMIKFLGDNKAHTISLLDADLNATGDIDEYDIQIERKLLLGLTLYQGAPTYNTHDENNDEIEMRLAAFVAPKLDEGFEKYAAAGFTTIIGEQRAVTEATGDDTDATDADNFDEYMTKAGEAGLDVLVQSGAITNMIGGAAYSYDTVKSEYEKASAYDNFRGFFMADEPVYNQLSTIETISQALKDIAKEKGEKLELFMAGHPTYAMTEANKVLWEDDTLGDTTKYYRYAESLGKSLGEYTYDFYPFRNKQEYWLGFIGTGNYEDYMRNDWLLNLKLAARASKDSQGAFDTGFVVQSYSEPQNSSKDGYLRAVGEEEISFQVYSALAYGMKSLNYFTYGEHWALTDNEKESWMANNDTIYNAVQTVNSQIKKFDHVLLNYNWVGTLGVTGSDNDEIMSQMNVDENETYASNRISEWSSKNATTSENADAIIGCLKDLNGYDGFMLVNVTDPSDDIDENISVTFKETLADGSEVVSTHATVYEKGDMRTVSLDNGTFTATLTPGQGIFVIPYIQ